MTRRAFLVIGAASVLLCDPATARAAQKDKLDVKLLVLAAASTADAVDAIRADFARLHPEVTVRTSFAASSALARQIEAGARADVFLSASSEWADFLEKKKLVARRRKDAVDWASRSRGRLRPSGVHRFAGARGR